MFRAILILLGALACGEIETVAAEVSPNIVLILSDFVAPWWQRAHVATVTLPYEPYRACSVAFP